MAARFLKGKRIFKIAGADLHKMLLATLNKTSGSCFYLGSTDQTLQKIQEKMAVDYPNIRVGSYSPPYKNKFDSVDNQQMLQHINDFKPDVLFVGMTAPKQEKWIFENKNKIDANITCAIGAVFDFYAGTIKRPPQWLISSGLEWFGRLLSDPKRLWKRYIIYNPVFVWRILKLKKSIR